MSESRDESPGNPILSYLQTLAATKKGLPHGQPVVAYISHNYTDSASLLQLAEELGPHIAILEIAAECVDDWSSHVIEKLQSISSKHGFLLWEGSKILNPFVDFMGRADVPLETRRILEDLIKKSYTSGPLKSATWSNLASSWAPAAPTGQQEQDMLIPTLRRAARETVATITKTIQTEISASLNHYPSGDEGETTDFTDLTVPSLEPSNGWKEFSPDNKGSALRKSSIISITTESVTPHASMGADNDMPNVPAMARSVVLCLPSTTKTAFTSEYRQSTVVAACANSDFVAGFFTTEPFYVKNKGTDIFELALPDSSENTEGMESVKNSISRYVSEHRKSLGVFSLIPSSLGLGFEFDPALQLRETPSSVQYLFYIIGQAVSSRNQNQRVPKCDRLREEILEGPYIWHIPVVLIP